MKCFLHEDRPATQALNIPCAPNGKIPVCGECYSEVQPGPLRKQLFDKYFASHREAVAAKRAEQSKHEDN